MQLLSRCFKQSFLGMEQLQPTCHSALKTFNIIIIFNQVPPFHTVTSLSLSEPCKHSVSARQINFHLPASSNPKVVFVVSICQQLPMVKANLKRTQTGMSHCHIVWTVAQLCLLPVARNTLLDNSTS